MQYCNTPATSSRALYTDRMILLYRDSLKKIHGIWCLMVSNKMLPLSTNMSSLIDQSQNRILNCWEKVPSKKNDLRQIPWQSISWIAVSLQLFAAPVLQAQVHSTSCEATQPYMAHNGRQVSLRLLKTWIAFCKSSLHCLHSEIFAEETIQYRAQYI